jgi:hypothetical protein
VSITEETETDDLVVLVPVFVLALEERLDAGAVFIDEHGNRLRTAEAILVALRRHGKVYGQWPRPKPRGRDATKGGPPPTPLKPNR